MSISEIEYISWQVAVEARRAEQEAAIEARNTESERQRPFVLLRPVMSIDGNQWCALYGENLQDGVAGFGDTPDLAARDFDRNWVGQKAPQS